MPHFEKSYAGVLSGLAAFFLYSVMDTTIKLGAMHYPLPVIIFLQSSVILSLLFIYSCFTRRPFLFGSNYPRRQLLRVVFHVISGSCGYYSFTQIPLATFYTVGFLGPLLIAIFAWFVFNDTPTRRTWLAIAIGFCGMLVIARPDTLPFNQGTMLAFIWIFFGAINIMFVRSMPLDNPTTFAAYTHTGLLTFMAFLALPDLGMFRLEDALLPLVGGCSAALANYCFYNAYRMAPSALVAPTQYSQIVWGALAGWFVFDTTLTPHLFGGALLIGFAGWLVISQARTPVPPHTQRRIPRTE